MYIGGDPLWLGAFGSANEPGWGHRHGHLETDARQSPGSHALPAALPMH